MTLPRASKGKTGSLSENENLLWRQRGVHTDLNCLCLSQSVRPARSCLARSIHSWCHQVTVLVATLKLNQDEEGQVRTHADKPST